MPTRQRDDTGLGPRRHALAYVRLATDACQRAVADLADGELSRSCIDLHDEGSTIGEVVVGHISHVARHLGMIEGVVGALGGRGTATV